GDGVGEGGAAHRGRTAIVGDRPGNRVRLTTRKPRIAPSRRSAGLGFDKHTEGERRGGARCEAPPGAAREAYSLYVERAAPGGNEANGSSSSLYVSGPARSGRGRRRSRARRRCASRRGA